MIEQILAGIVGMVIGGVLLAGIFYALAPAFTRRGASGADIDGRIDKLKIYFEDKLTNDLPHALEASLKGSLTSIGASILGQKGAAAKKESSLNQAGLASLIGQMSGGEGTPQDMQAILPEIMSALPKDWQAMAKKNPALASMVMSKIMGAMQGGGGGGISGGNTPNY